MSEEKTYTLRELEGDDIFLMSSVIKKIGVVRIRACLESASIKSAMGIMLGNGVEESKKEEAMNKIGIAVMLEITGTVIESLPECKEEIYNLLASVSGMKRDDIAHMKIVPLIRMIKDFFRKPEFRDFFTEAIGFLG